MGIPYSREINAAFDQVTPLVAAGFKVLKTTKNISILLAVIQVLTVLFLALILWVMIALVYCVNPDLEVCCFLKFGEDEGVWRKEGTVLISSIERAPRTSNALIPAPRTCNVYRHPRKHGSRPSRLWRVRGYGVLLSECEGPGWN